MSPETRRLIITADDFGLSLPVNEAVEVAHRRGILSAASLMVGAPAADDAVERARALPKLGVGLHLTLLESRPVLPRERVPALVGPDGRFGHEPVRFGIALYFSREMRRQAEAEIEAQFARFAESGLVMDHINGHKHFHLHPVVLRKIVDLAPHYGSPPVRVPHEPVRPFFRPDLDQPLRRMASWLFYLGQTHRLRRALSRAGLRFNDHVFGLYDSGAVTEARLRDLVARLPAGISEVYCHPAARRWDGPDNLPASYRCEEELAALLSPALGETLKAAGLRPLSFRLAVAD